MKMISIYDSSESSLLLPNIRLNLRWRLTWVVGGAHVPLQGPASSSRHR